jgi:hypothetical protein
MDIIRNWKGLCWQVYNEYETKDIKNKLFIIPNIKSGIKAVFNPTSKEEFGNLTKRKPLLIRFAELGIEDSDILTFVNQYGLLWTDYYKFKKNEITGDSLDDIKEEIITFKKAFDIYMALKKNDIEKLKETIKLVKTSEFYLKKTFRGSISELLKYDQITSEKSLKSNNNVENFIVSADIKKEPLIELTIEKYRQKEEIRYITFLYLIELISKKIKDNKGAFPYYSKIDYSEENIIGFAVAPSLECSNLASALWIQFYSAVTTGQIIMECQYCGKPFLRTGKVLFCDDKCSNKKHMQIKRYNRRLREKEKLKTLFILLVIFKKTQNFANLVMAYYRYSFKSKTKKKENTELPDA